MNWLLGFLLLVTMPSPGRAQPAAQAEWMEINGRTMGTGYSLRFNGSPLNPRHSRLSGEVVKVLAEINQVMSTYQADSELMILNSAATTDWVPVSEDLYEVLREALYWSRKSEGAFDITVEPLVNLWGFGRDPAAFVIPPRSELERVRLEVGYQLLELRPMPAALRKRRPGVRLDLSAIAKGYAVDRLVDLLRSTGLDRCLVEIGGELKALGRGPQGESWVVGIEDPGGEEARHRIALSGMAVATSGNYRQFLPRQGRRLSHLLDPRTGQPIEHSLVSVTVIHQSAMTADALSTAIMVLGPEAGYRLALRENLAVLLLEERAGSLRESMTPSFQARLLPESPEKNR